MSMNFNEYPLHSSKNVAQAMSKESTFISQPLFKGVAHSETIRSSSCVAET